MPADFCGTEGRGGENTCEQTLAVAAILSATAWIVGMREGGRSYVRRKLFDGSEVGDGCGRTYVGVNHGILRFPIVPLSVVNSIRIYCDASRVTRESSQSSPTRKAEGIEQARAVLIRDTVTKSSTAASYESDIVRQRSRVRHSGREELKRGTRAESG